MEIPTGNTRGRQERPPARREGPFGVRWLATAFVKAACRRPEKRDGMLHGHRRGSLLPLNPKREQAPALQSGKPPHSKKAFAENRIGVCQSMTRACCSAER